ncbi:hypothetical protein LJR164_003547 [Phenylobacterium sp. LjRoot164]|uniref:hypothetical protein n=1 Tax=unclassified Phenylobacterium TaxID=2640670 RepID=UPI003ECF2690
MGSLSWIGLKGLERAQALELLGMTEEPPSRRRPTAWIGELPSGWTILQSQDSRFASEERLSSLSTTCAVIGCQFSETVMCATTTFYRDGQVAWRVDYDCEKGAPEVTGVPPSEYQAIHDRLTAEQAVEDASDDDLKADLIFDVPIDLAKAVTGYRHDEDVDAEFVAVEAPQAARSGGWLSRLFGAKG